MEAFEYVIILSSLILGLGIAQLLKGAADMVSNWKAINFSLPHGLLILVIFIIHIQEWWITYQYQLQIEVWTLPVVMALLSFPIILFLQARMIFPTGPRSKEIDMKKYFMDQWRGIYILGAITVVISILQNLLISEYGWTDQLLLLAYLAAYLVMFIVNIQNMVIHTVFISLQLVIWIIFILTDQSVL